MNVGKRPDGVASQRPGGRPDAPADGWVALAVVHHWTHGRRRGPPPAAHIHQRPEPSDREATVQRWTPMTLLKEEGLDGLDGLDDAEEELLTTSR